MYFPQKQDYLSQDTSGKAVPVYREILADMETPVSAFKKIAGGGCAFLLESVERGERLGRYSFLGTSPRLVLRSSGGSVRLQHSDGMEDVVTLADGQDPLDVVHREMERYDYVQDPKLPKFCGGAVGYIGYDIVKFFEPIPGNAKDDLEVPDCLLAFTDTVLVFDHVKNVIKIVAYAYSDADPGLAYDEAVQRIEDTVAKLKSPLPYEAPQPRNVGQITPISNFTREGFEDAVRKCKEYISAGDIIQVVLSQRFQTTITADPFDIYRALRSINPSPYMFYLTFDDLKLIGSSPEILVTNESGKVTVRPIAGTRHRGATDAEDLLLERELLADEKERAEHVMLVDLGRNDIGRVCDFGTVNVDSLMDIERYSHVMHIVSNVNGRMMADKDQYDLLRATFPAGTVSGAPKIRAMQIIDELEPTQRGTYAGSVGYFSHSGDTDLCITIRSILIKSNTAYIQAGAGIVADSIPENEYQESINKASAMFRAIEAAEAGLQ